MKKLETLRCTLVGIVSLLATGASAEESPAAAPGKNQVEPAQAAVAMEDPRAGDYWTYEIKDEISGSLTATRTDTITEVTPSQIGVSYFNREKGTTGFSVYDHDWNTKNADAMKYTPHSGLGIVSPLKVGALWNFKVEQVNTEKGLAWKWSGQSKVSGQEQITTKIGVFDTFKIETKYTFYPVGNPGRKGENTVQTWYAPSVDHWVRRTITSRIDNLLRSSQNIELVAYGRKQ